LAHLQTAEWERLLDLADRFERAWREVGPQADSVDLDPFLPPPGDALRRVALHELIKTDLEIRWRRGQAMSLESYLQRFPELGAARSLPPHLIFEEYCVRHAYGDKPPLANYQSRFPDQYPVLQRLAQDQPLPTARNSTLLPFTPTGAPPAPAASASGPRPRVLPVGEGYKLIKRIGSGGFGEVWQAEAPGGVEVAVKIILRPLEHETAQQELNALELIKKLRHTYLLQTHAYWPLEDRLIIVMELADASLRDRLKEYRQQGRDGIPVDELLPYLRQAAEAIDYLHGAQVLHRDIKPENMLLLGDHAKVADFGLARFLKSQEMVVTQTGSGTPPYMAPEIWRHKVSPHSDQYSLAVTYVELRLGRRLFAGRDLIELMHDHLSSKPDLDPLPPAEQRVLLKALAKDPGHRYTSCRDFAQALERAVHPPLPPPFALGRLLRTTGLVLALLVALVGLIWPLVRPRGTFVVREWPAELRLKAGGDGQDLRVAIRRDGFRQEVALTCPDPPPGVVISGATIAADDDEVLVRAYALLEARPGTYPVTLCVGGDPEKNVALVLTVDPSYWRDDYHQPANAQLLRVRDKKYWCYDRIAVERGGLRVPFLLIPQGPADNEPSSFYIMEDKVSNELFGQFARATDLKNSRWEQGATAGDKDLGVANGRLPVMRVTVAEAHQCARWLGGWLPTTQQWDKAAGLYEPDPGDGPFLQPWRRGEPGIAVGRRAEGPLEVGTADKDRSRFHCRDMAGNGYEWTRDLYNGRRPVPLERPTDTDEVNCRSQSYRADQPFQFKDVKNNFPFYLVPYLETDKAVKAQYPLKAEPDVGFRVVLELP
jgi:hypothetical protein